MTIAPPRRVFRSYFYVPSHREEVAREAYASDADAVVFDLEGLVPDDQKDAARANAARWLQSELTKPTLVRINTIDSGLVGADIEATVTPNLYAIRSPKTEHPDDIRSIARLVDGARARIGRVDPIGLQVMIESALGLERAFDIALATESIWSLGLGEGDLRHDLGTATDEGLAFARSRIVNAARAARLPGPVQVAYPSSGSLDGLRTSTERGLSLGFTGRSITSTPQAPIVNEIYSRSPAHSLVPEPAHS